uniref:Uncharacterized protein n=1 Tax=Populus trichocarpa TaxID=3694 RepID=A0A3N7F948_POPTR
MYFQHDQLTRTSCLCLSYKHICIIFLLES